MSSDKFQVVSSSLNSFGLIKFNKRWRCGSKKSFVNRRHSRTFVCISASLSSRNLEKYSKKKTQTKYKGQSNYLILYQEWKFLLQKNSEISN